MRTLRSLSKCCTTTSVIDRRYLEMEQQQQQQQQKKRISVADFSHCTAKQAQARHGQYESSDESRESV